MSTGEGQVDALVMQEADSVAILLKRVVQGEEVTVRSAAGCVLITSRQDIPRFHKIALRRLGVGAPVTRSGVVIGESTSDIEAGDWVHVHNIRSLRARSPSAPDTTMEQP